MSRPARYAGANRNSHSNATPAERNTANGPNSAPAPASNKYPQALPQLRSIFSDWKDEDLISILDESRGDVELAVARISEGHVEQWGAVKHKRDKKMPLPRERERDRDGHSPRGTSSPRGRGRGSRGGNFQSGGTPRQHREKTANGVVPTPATNGTPLDAGEDSAPVVDQSLVAGTTGDGWGAESASTSLDPYPPVVDTPKPPTASSPAPAATTSKGPRKVPVSSGISWAQIAKPQPKVALATPRAAPSVPEPPPHPQEAETEAELSTVQPEATGWEDPTTATAPTFDEEPIPTEPSIISEAPSEDWINIPTPTADTEADPVSQQSTEPLSTEAPETLKESPTQPLPTDPVVSRPEPPETIPPPPGLASPANTQHSKPSTPSNSRPSYAARLSSRYKTDQAVVLPPSAGFGKSLPLQFGSLNLSDDNEIGSEPVKQEASSIEQKIAPSLAPQTTEPQPVPSVSPAHSFRAQTQTEVPVASPEPSVSHTQAPSINPSLAAAPSPGPGFPPQQQQQPPSIPSQHTLAGLTHAPQQPTQQQQQAGLGHTSHPSFGQPTFPPQQQQFESGGIGISGGSLSNLAQASQSQNQAFFRQTDSPFYNQPQSQLGDHGFTSGSNFSQGVQSGFNSGLAPVGDFGYEGPRNPYDSYNTPGSFGSRGGLRQDEVKGLGGASGAGLSMHHGQNQSNQLGGNQSAGAPNQNQYPAAMTHMVNPYYYNTSPFGYGNQYYSPAAFTSFVNPMYQAGGNQTPPHNSKPGNLGGTGGLGVTSNNSYSSANPGHLHHSSSGFDSDAGPGGTPTYHQSSPGLTGDFSKGVYSGQGFLGNMGVSSGGGRGQVGGAGSVGPAPGSDAGFKGYGAASGTPSSLVGQDKASTTQSRGTPNVNQGQQFYQNPRFPTGTQGQGYQQPPSEQFYGYQTRW